VRIYNRPVDEVLAEYYRVNLSSDPIYRYIRTAKGGPGGVPGRSAETDLLDNAWLQRLRRIHQLQSAWWVFATAEHSRFQHSLGAMHLAGEWARHLYPSLRRVHPDAPSAGLVEETLRLAGLLHDVGHGPFGHFFDETYLTRWNLDHEIIGRQLVTSQLAALIEGIGASPNLDFEAGESIDCRWIAYLVSTEPVPGFEPPAWLSALRPLLIGPYSADNMDYVPRDSYICGVATGPVDVQRIIHYSFISEFGLTLHSHGAEALFMFLNARLYLYHQVYFHRTVRRIDLQLREIFVPTMDILLGGNPLERLPEFQRLNEWYLMTEVDRWAQEESGERRELGRAWGDIVARRLKWRMIFSDYVEAHGVPTGVLMMGRDEFASRLREKLPPECRDVDFEVDVASQESRAFNPLSEATDILFYEPLDQTYRHSRVLDLFRRLPVRMVLFRIFAREDTYRKELVHAAQQVLAAD